MQSITSVLAFLFSFSSAFASVGATALSSQLAFSDLFRIRLQEATTGADYLPIDSTELQNVQAHQYVLYPGAGGNRPGDVFTDNRRSIIEDYGVAPEDVTIRDIEVAYGVMKDIVPANVIRQNEPQYLRSLYEASAAQNGGRGKKLVLMAHSLHGIELFETIMAMKDEFGEDGIIDRVVFIQSQTEGGGNGGASQEFLNSAKSKIYFVQTNRPFDIGTSLGAIGLGTHIDPVVAVPRVKQPYAFRRAFTRTVLEKIFP